MKILYNPKCSKCRIAKEYFKEQNPELIEYLKTPPTKQELKEILTKGNLKVQDIIRTKEPQYQHYKDKNLSQDQWLQILTKHPVLIQRPIIITETKAVVARSQDALEQIH